ncbi:hypothetical protein Tsubulata_040471 [Turnera subulata]|uniref:Bifunctional inhibitor/plant lipid transfer protein/seed storage helical domain-containing protein n=1 Tax=Turnera subulata TaxID=218843 RepID=A0A9Q0FRA5_9ROSI|nr:hypothetical protein Tsubulata_040471 [Turnera subulata]
MASSTALKLVCMVLMCMFAGALAQSISCGQVAYNLRSCIYTLQGAAPTTACCSALNSTVTQATTSADLQGLCTCLTVADGTISGFNTVVGLAVDIAADKCGVTVPFEISPDTNCTSV